MPTINTAGRYDVRVQTCEVGQTESGSARIYLFFTTEEHESIGGWLYLTEKAFPYTVKTLREVFDFDGNFETVVSQVQEKQCSITVEIEEYNGKERAVVKFVNRYGSGPIGAGAPIADATSFLRNLTAKAKRIPVPVGKPPF
jgi:hypothetical protein